MIYAGAGLFSPQCSDHTQSKAGHGKNELMLSDKRLECKLDEPTRRSDVKGEISVITFADPFADCRHAEKDRRVPFLPPPVNGWLDPFRCQMGSPQSMLVDLCRSEEAAESPRFKSQDSTTSEAWPCDASFARTQLLIALTQVKFKSIETMCVCRRQHFNSYVWLRYDYIKRK
jgi:hypothetical protein